MKENRAKYLQTILLLDEIVYFHSSLSFNEPKTFFRELKHNIITLYKFKEFLQLVNKNLKDNPDFIKLKKSIFKELDFINHIRNKISGHFDTILLIKAAQWEPSIFYEENNNEEFKVLMAYKTLFESSINSYINNYGKHLFYNGEIDLNFPNDRAMFLETIFKLNKTSIKILNLIKYYLENQNIKFGKDQQYFEAIKAGQTNFNLKSNNEEFINISKPLIEESFLKSLDWTNINDLKLLITKLEEIIIE